MKKLRITVEGVAYEVDVEVLQDDEESGGWQTTSAIPPLPTSTKNTTPPPSAGRDLAPAPAASASQPSAGAPASGAGDGAGDNTLTSPIAGIVVEVKVTPGASVKEHEPVVVLEAMKMKTNVSSPVTAAVKTVHVNAGDSVRTGDVLLTFA